MSEYTEHCPECNQEMAFLGSYSEGPKKGQIDNGTEVSYAYACSTPGCKIEIYRRDYKLPDRILESKIKSKKEPQRINGLEVIPNIPLEDRAIILHGITKPNHPQTQERLALHLG